MSANRIVSTGLKERNDKSIIYMKDVITTYTRVSFIENKSKDTVINRAFKFWLSLFGAAEIYLMDNGGAFANDEIR